MNFEDVCKKSLQTIAVHRSGAATPVYGLSAMQSAYKWLDNWGGQNFFLGLLRSFSMTPAERKEIEAGARYFGIRTKRFSLPRDEHWKAAFEKHFDKLEALYVTACRVVGRGEACKSEQFCTARCFRLVNTGDYPVKTMQAVQVVVDRAAQLLDGMGFGQLCYGDVYVTQTVMGSSKTLAFYMPSDDRMYVRANLKGVEGAALNVVLHELGHRLEHMFSTPTINAMIGMLYRSYRREYERHGGIIGGEEPKPGDRFVYKNEPFEVTKVIGSSVHLQGAEPEIRAARLTMPLAAWLRWKGGKPTVEPFPTQYSMKTVHEFFAEMFALEMEGKLGERRTKDFEPILLALSQNTTATRTLKGRSAGRRRH